MTPKEKAIDLINSYRIILMNEDTECGNEILCTLIAKRCALIAVDEILNSNPSYDDYGGDGWKIIDNTEYWQEVKQKIEKL